MRGTLSVRRKTRRLGHPSRSRAQRKRKPRRKSNRRSRRMSRRRRTTRYHRRQEGGTKEKHDSYERKWLRPDLPTNSGLRLENAVEIKRSGVEYSQKKHLKELAGEKEILLYTTNHVDTDMEGKPTTTVLYRSGETCPIQTIEQVPQNNEGGEQTYVVWVRHCHSCSNAGGEGIGVITKPMSKFREPLCTALGSRQALDAGTYLGRLLSKAIPAPEKEPSTQKGDAKLVLTSGGNCCVRFYSSFLARTFHTAKLMAASYAAQRMCGVTEGHQTIKRLCHVGEETKWYEYENTETPSEPPKGWLPKLPKSRLKTRLEGSQSVTNQRKSNNHAWYLNKQLNVGFPIEDKQTDGCGKGDGPIAGSRIGKLACDYRKFLVDVLPTLEGEGECDKKKTTINVIVSHGGYIRHCVLQSTKKHPANTQMYLVRYTSPTNAELPIHAEILSTEASTFDHSTSLNIPIGLYEAAGNSITDCSYTYHKDMVPDD